MTQPKRGFVYQNMEVNGSKVLVVSINLETVTVRENNQLNRYPLSAVNKMDLYNARQKFIGTL